MRVLEIFRIVHGVVKAAKNHRALGDDVVADGNVVRRVVGNAGSDEGRRPHALQQDGVHVVKLGPVI